MTVMRGPPHCVTLAGHIPTGHHCCRRHHPAAGDTPQTPFTSRHPSPVTCHPSPVILSPSPSPRHPITDGLKPPPVTSPSLTSHPVTRFLSPVTRHLSPRHPVTCHPSPITPSHGHTVTRAQSGGPTVVLSNLTKYRAISSSALHFSRSTQLTDCTDLTAAAGHYPLHSGAIVVKGRNALSWLGSPRCTD